MKTRQESKNKNIFSILVIGEALRDLYLWKRHGFIVYFVDIPSQISRMTLPLEIDMVFLATPVTWLSIEEGTFDSKNLEKDVDIIRSHGYFHHHLVLSNILPIGVADHLGCHYCPLLPMIPERHIVGIHLSFVMDMELFRSIFYALLDSFTMKITRDAEMLCLIDTCQTWINTSFQREISLFCSKISQDFSQKSSTSLRKELYPILVYMIRQIEETKLDCPLLYSCLFRHNYIDIQV